MKNYLITGGSGFLGQTLLQILHSDPIKDCRCFLLGRTPIATAGDDRWLQGTVTHFGQSASDLTDLKKFEINGIFHLAALVRHTRQQSQEVYETNVQGTLNVVRLAAQLRCRMVFVSTSGVVGCFSSLEKSADEDAPYVEQKIRNWPYYHSKMQAEIAARALADELGVELVIIRPPVLLGPGDKIGRSTHLIAKIIAKKLPVIIKGGYHFVDIRDVAKALVHAVSIAKPRPIYHLPGFSSSLADFCRRVALIAQVPRPLCQLPAKWLKPLSPFLSFVPDPVMLEMGSCYWGLTSKYSAQDLQYIPRSSESTLVDTIRDLQSRAKQSH